MTSRKRGRTSSTRGFFSSDVPGAPIQLSGGSPLSPGQLELWRSGQLTDTVVTVEGRSFDAVKFVLAAGSE